MGYHFHCFNVIKIAFIVSVDMVKVFIFPIFMRNKLHGSSEIIHLQKCKLFELRKEICYVDL